MREIEELARNENISLCWDPFKDWVTVDLDHYLPELRGNNNNGKGGFIDTNILPEPGGDISDAKVLEVFSWMRAYWEESGEEYTIGDNVDIVDATTLALKFEGLPHIDPKSRLMFTTENECMQLCIINGTIHMTFDGTDEKNKKESHFSISKYNARTARQQKTHSYIQTDKNLASSICISLHHILSRNRKRTSCWRNSSSMETALREGSCEWGSFIAI